MVTENALFSILICFNLKSGFRTYCFYTLCGLAFDSNTKQVFRENVNVWMLCGTNVSFVPVSIDKGEGSGRHNNY